MLLKIKIAVIFLVTLTFESLGQSKEIFTYQSVLEHYSKTNEPEKLKAAIFLIDNMSIHKSTNYKWVDSLSRTVYFNELDYSDMDEALVAFEKLKDSVEIHPQKYDQEDNKVVSPSFMIQNIDMAFASWKNNPWSQQYNFETFCEYILPYRSLVEPLEKDWRKTYQNIVLANNNEVKAASSFTAVATATIQSFKEFRFEKARQAPVPFLSPKQLLFRRAGSCPDLANLAVLACRSVGIAATFDFTPHNAASSNRHFWNTLVNEHGEHIPFNGVTNGLPYTYNPLTKRLGKIYRYTFSIDKNSLASIVEPSEIPKGFLKNKNVLDVTKEYVEVGEINYKNPWKDTPKIAYLNVFNISRWKVVDWAKANEQTYAFQNLGTDLVYLPSTYNNSKSKFAPHPVLLKKNKETKILKPNYIDTFHYVFDINNAVENTYSDYNPFYIVTNERYKLLVWDKRWKSVDECVAENDFSLSFKNVPKNGLFYIVSKNSNHYERPFIIEESTQKIKWY